MKTKYFAALILAAILISIWPLSTFAAEIEPDYEHIVTCLVLPEYDFSVSDDMEISYPDTSVVLGEFVVGDLLLRSGETLSVSLSLGQMSDYKGEKLIYNLVSSVPGNIDSSQSGLSYDISLYIDPTEFEDASFGTYSAPLLFQVTSNVEEEVVWSQTVYIKAVKNGNENNSQTVVFDTSSDAENEDDETTEGSGEQDDNEQMTTEPTDESLLTIEDEQSARGSEQVADDETTFTENTSQQRTIPYWVYIMLGGLGLFLLSVFTILYVNKDDNKEKG